MYMHLQDIISSILEPVTYMYMYIYMYVKVPPETAHFSYIKIDVFRCSCFALSLAVTEFIHPYSDTYVYVQHLVIVH